MRQNNIFLDTNNINKSGYVWNMIASIALAVQSAVVLVVMTRTNPLEDAGVFSIAYAISTLMLYIGQFGVKKFQISDVNEEYSFQEYFGFRIITSIAMMAAAVTFSAFGFIFRGYSTVKFCVIIIICLIQLTDSFDDLFFGRFQQVGRLDVASKATSFRVILGTATCMVSLILTGNLILSVAAWLLTVTIALFVSSVSVAKNFCTLKASFRIEKMRGLFRANFPLFAGTFLLLYIGNAPKYAIDLYLNEEAQAIFNFIFMPVFVVGLFANFIFNPIIVDLAESWNNGEIPAFVSGMKRQAAVVCGITAFCITGGFAVGCPILSLLYNTDLSDRRTELCVLLLGGGMLAMVNLFTVGITIIRKQSLLTAGYVAAAFIAKLTAHFFIRHYALMGAAIMYTFIIGILMILFGIILIYNVARAVK